MLSSGFIYALTYLILEMISFEKKESVEYHYVMMKEKKELEIGLQYEGQ